uniref:J domain-containing protein n=1 Tax=Caenorhabditis japonica TaxID=281687 RepID=A0A8R1EQZ5_CAEJA
MLRLGLAQQRRSLFGSIPCSSQQDHYKVLGLAQSASQKDIKSAYYALSKRHHPDTNPTDKEEAAKKFHQVAMAYEILGSEDKRKAYDMTRIRSSPMPTSSSHPMSNRYRQRSSSQKQYTDVDIDYKDFEHFQRSTRRRPQYHSHFEMPNEFYAEFGGFKKRVFKSEYEQAQAEMRKRCRFTRALGFGSCNEMTEKGVQSTVSLNGAHAGLATKVYADMSIYAQI